MNPKAKIQFSEFKTLVPLEFTKPRQPRYKEFQHLVGDVLRRYRDTHLRGTNDKLARHQKWSDWFEQITFDENWEAIRGINDEQAADIMRAKSDAIFHLAVYYRFHSLLSELKWADEIDELIFKATFRDRGIDVFVEDPLELEAGVSSAPIAEVIDGLVVGQQKLLDDNTVLKEQLTELHMQFRQHLRRDILHDEVAARIVVKAEGKIARNNHIAAERLFQKAVRVLTKRRSVAFNEQTAKVHIERARNFVLQENVVGALTAYREAMSLVPFSEEIYLYCELCSFIAISFDRIVENTSVRFPARRFMFENDYPALLLSLINSGNPSISSETIFPRVTETVALYTKGEGYRGWTAMSEEAGDHLMRAAKEQDSTILADIALLGFEYMAMSYNSGDDPTEVRFTIEKRLLAIHFLNGNKEPSEDDLSVGNIYSFI